MTRTVRLVVLLVAIVVAVWLLFTIVFPWVSRTFIDDPTMSAAGVAAVVTALG